MPRLPILVMLASASAAAQELPPPPLVSTEGKVLKPSPPAPPSQPQPAPAATPAPTEPEPAPVQVAAPPAEAPQPEAVVAPKNAVSLDLVRLLDLAHGVVPAAGLAYDRRLTQHVGLDVGVRFPFTFSASQGSEYVKDSVGFTDSAYPSILVGGRYQFVGRDFSGPFVSGAVAITPVQTTWWTTAPKVNIPTQDGSGNSLACTPGGKTYCLVAVAGSLILNGGFSWTFFGHLLVEAALGFDIGFGGTEVNWISASGTHYTHDFRPPLSFDLALAIGYAF